jgi:hypothetical protein
LNECRNAEEGLGIMDYGMLDAWRGVALTSAAVLANHRMRFSFFSTRVKACHTQKRQEGSTISQVSSDLAQPSTALILSTTICKPDLLEISNLYPYG